MKYTCTGTTCADATLTYKRVLEYNSDLTQNKETLFSVDASSGDATVSSYGSPPITGLVLQASFF